MKNESKWLEDFQDTSDDIIQAALLLEGMLLWQKQPTHRLNVPRELSDMAFRRAFDYLFQHTFDLYLLGQRVE